MMVIIGKRSTILSKHCFFLLSDDKLHITLDLFWSEYIEFNCNIDPFDGDEYDGEENKFVMEIFICVVRRIHYHSQKFLVL